jgi:hypothetical protein
MVCLELIGIYHRPSSGAPRRDSRTPVPRCYEIVTRPQIEEALPRSFGSIILGCYRLEGDFPPSARADNKATADGAPNCEPDNRPPSPTSSFGFAMTGDDCTYQLVLYDATTGKEIRRATVLDTHRLNVGDDIGGYRIVRVRPESTREVGHVDVVTI